MRSMILTLAGATLMSLVGCQSMPPIHTVAQVDLERFMGDWYVVANIPIFIEKKAFNAVETYRLTQDGSIQTTFTFNKGGFDGPLKTYTPHAIDSRRGVPEGSSVFGAGRLRHRQGEKGATHARRLTVVQFDRPHRADHWQAQWCLDKKQQGGRTCRKMRPAPSCLCFAPASSLGR